MLRLLELRQGFGGNASLILTREPCQPYGSCTGERIQNKESPLALLLLVSSSKVLRLEQVVGGSNHSCHPPSLSQKEADSAALGEAELEFHHSSTNFFLI